jgi:hypothetical protein
MTLFDLVTQKDLLDFSQNYSIVRNYMGDSLFPDQKTQNFEAEYIRLADTQNLPYAAMVHGFDSEAAIGERKDFERVTVQKLLIKEKINLTEQARMLLDHGVQQNSILQYLFDDMGRMAETVKTRTEAMKMEALQTGKVTVQENKVTLQMDYKVPTGNVVNSTASWADPSADILGDIQTWVDIGSALGQKLTLGVTSTPILRLMQKNTAIQKAVNGANGTGMLVTPVQLNNLLSAMFSGLTLLANDATYIKYADTKKRGKKTSTRFFAENALSLFAPQNDGSAGIGLWGVTPEEEAAGPYTEKSSQQFITLSRWEEPDPVAVWTKASGLFIPVLPNPSGLVCATINMAKP